MRERRLHVNHALKPRATLFASGGVRVRGEQFLAAQPSLAVTFNRFRRNVLESSHFSVLNLSSVSVGCQCAKGNDTSPVGMVEAD